MYTKVLISVKRRCCILTTLISVLFLPTVAPGVPDILQDPLRVQPDRLHTGATFPDGSLIASTCAADLSQPLALESAIDIALCNNPQIRSAWAGIKTQSAVLGEARAKYLPTIKISISRLATRTSYSSFTGTPSSVLTGDQIYGSINWSLLDFGGRSANNNMASQMLLAALAAHEASLQKIMAGVIQAYFDAMMAQSNYVSRKKMADIAETVFSATKRREAGGAAPLSDTLQAATALAKAQLNEARAKGEFSKSQSQLVQSMGLAPGTALLLPQTLELNRADEVKELSLWLQEAKEQHPAIRQARAKSAADKAKISMARSEGLPSLEATAYFSTNGYPNQGLSFSNQSVKVAGLTLNVPIFEGFGRTYKIRGAEAQAEQSEAQLQDTSNQILTEVVKAHADALTSLGTLKAALRLMGAAKQSLNSSLRRYERHAADILEVLNCQSSLADAEQERNRAVAEWRSARLRLQANSGHMGKADFLEEQP